VPEKRLETSLAPATRWILASQRVDKRPLSWCVHYVHNRKRAISWKSHDCNHVSSKLIRKKTKRASEGKKAEDYLDKDWKELERRPKKKRKVRQNRATTSLRDLLRKSAHGRNCCLNKGWRRVATKQGTGQPEIRTSVVFPKTSKQRMCDSPRKGKADQQYHTTY